MNEEQEFVSYENEPLRSGNTAWYGGRGKMAGPSNALHTRAGTIRIRALFTMAPTVTVTIWALDNPGTMFSVNTINFNAAGNETHITVNASNVEIGLPSDKLFIMDYVVVGNTL